MKLFPITYLSLALTISLLIGCKKPASEADSSKRDPFQVTLIANGPLTDFGFNQAQKEALDQVQEILGDKVKTQALGDIPETGDAERTIRRLVASGSDLVIAASFGYQDTSVKLAADYPKTKFLQAWGFKPSPNLGTYSAKMYEAWYVMGIVAGKMTQSNKLGIVAAHPIPPMKWQINAYILGAQSVNPSVTGSVAFINHWFDPSLASEATEALINQGCDVVCGVLDNSVAVAQTAEKRGIMLIGHNTDLSRFAPKSCLVGTRWLWGKLYADAVEQMMADTWKGTEGDLNGGFNKGYVGITSFNTSVPEPVKNAALQAIERIKSGSLAVYTGPISDNKGNVVVPAGTTLTHDQIMAMDWMVEGIK